MADRQSRATPPRTSRRPLLPAWLYVAATVLGTAIAVAIVVANATDRPTVRASRASSHHAQQVQSHQTLSTSNTPADAKRHDPTTSSTTPPAHAVVAANTTTTTTDPPAPTTTPTTSTTPISKPVVQPTTPSSSTSTSLANTTTTTMPVVRTTMKTKIVSGTLAAPFTTASIPFTTAAGVVNATTTWSGDGALRATLRCPGAASSHVASSGGVYVAVHAKAGSCDLTLSEPGTADIVISYEIAIEYRQVSS